MEQLLFSGDMRGVYCQHKSQGNKKKKSSAGVNSCAKQEEGDGRIHGVTAKSIRAANSERSRFSERLVRRIHSPKNQYCPDPES